MPLSGIDAIPSILRRFPPVRRLGRVHQTKGNLVDVTGLGDVAKLADRVMMFPKGNPPIPGDVVQIGIDHIVVLPSDSLSSLAVSDRVVLEGPQVLSADASWLGEVIDPDGRRLEDGRLLFGTRDRPINTKAPNAQRRRALGPRLDTGLCALNTVLPLVRGQRIGLFASAGVGKSTLLGHLVERIEADAVVVALVGERGREVREFVQNFLRDVGMQKSVVVAATSDTAPAMRRRCAFSAMTIAETLRDQGMHVLYVCDSITRMAEAHREVALAGGETAENRGFPPSLTAEVAGLVERAGTGEPGQGDITAVFSVLVAADDLDEPISDIMRGMLDGHVVLNREIAERGRYPAIDLLKSVSRSLPGAATDRENELIAKTRKLMASYEESELMVRTGFHTEGVDETLDHAVAVWPKLDAFLAKSEYDGIASSFQRLEDCLEKPPTKDDETTSDITAEN